MGASESEAREFAAAFRAFLEWIGAEALGEDRNEVAALVGDFLGAGALERSVVTRSLASFEHVNLQTALEAWSREPGREVLVHGLMLPPHFGGMSLQQIVTGEVHSPCGCRRHRSWIYRTGRVRLWRACCWRCCWCPMSAAVM